MLIATPGSAAVKLLEAKPGDSPEELETALTSLLVGRLDLVDRVRVGAVEQGLEIEMTNPRLSEKGLPFYDFLGSPLVSIAAAVAAESLGKPLTISAEKHQKGKSVVTLEVVR